MERNLYHRVEVAFPLLDKKMQERVRSEALDLPWNDNMEAWDMQPNGQYLSTLEDASGKMQHPQKRLLKLLK